MIDFHTHIMTPGSSLPPEDGDFYHTLKPITSSGQWLDLVWQETIETIAENLRSASALHNLRPMSPIIYSEMVRRMARTNGDKLMGEMRRQGVRQAVIVAMDPVVPTDEVIDVCEQSDGMLLAFGSVDPWAEDWEQRLKCTMAKPIAGFKFHSNIQSLAFGSPRMRDILDVMTQQNFSKPIYVHTGDYPIYKPLEGDWVYDLNDLLGDYPSLNFVCGHCGWNRPDEALSMAQRHDNVWLETSWQPPRVLRDLCNKLGADRLVMGSDYPLFSMRRAIQNCKLALTPSEFETVSEKTAAKLLFPAEVSNA